MNAKVKLISLFLVLALLAVLVSAAPATSAAPNQSDQPDAQRVQPALLAYANNHPGETVRVIVQKQSNRAVDDLIADLGGQIVRDLHIINAVAAQVPAETVTQLATSAGVRWVSLDAQMETAGTPGTETVRDQFDYASYNRNDGTANWASDWQEIGESDGPRRGRVEIDDSYSCTTGSCLRIGHWDGKRIDGRGISRSVDLSGATWASLSFSYQVHRFDYYSDGSVTLSISSDGGATWTDLETYSLHRGGWNPTERQFDITPYISPNTQIRWLGAGGDVEAFLYVDNLQIEYTGGGDQHQLETLGVRQLWREGIDGTGVAVAVVDSGISPNSDIGSGRLAARLGFSTNTTSLDDTYGHGSHVGGIIAGDGSFSNGAYSGIAPGANLISLRISDDTGMAYESDTVAALQWIHDHKDEYNIRVVNLSVNSTQEQSYHNSALDAAAEILWFNKIVVVASAGNKGPAGSSNTARSAPANDPFIISVGASDEKNTSDPADDTVAPFSAFGVTDAGYVKPDIIAPGYNIVSLLSEQSTWGDEYPDRVLVDGHYIRLSGTSMSAPMVSGAVALLLQDEPNLTPDQVKYRLTQSSRTIASKLELEDSTLTIVQNPYLDIYSAVHGQTTGSANSGIEASQLLWSGNKPIMWDSVNWNSVNWNSVNWNSVNWNSVNWNSVELNGIFWGKGKDNSKAKGKGKH